MGLIVCKKCGHKISDTVENCIHCGQVTINDCVDSKPEDAIDKQNINLNSSIINYLSLDRDTKRCLETEFLNQDKWAIKYYQTTRALTFYSKAWLMVTAWIVLIFQTIEIIYLFIDNDKKILSSYIVNDNLFRISTALLAILYALLIAMVLYSIIKKIQFKATFAKYVYLRKYQKWLKDQKQIEYVPVLCEKENIIFDSIDLNVLNY